MQTEPILELEGVTRHFVVSRGPLGRPRRLVRAVEDVSLSVHKGTTLGLVGESGCGKTTLGRCMTRLDEPTSGRVLFEGHDILTLGRGALRTLRREMQTVFQDPYSSLNPRRRIGDAIADAFAIHALIGPKERRQRVEELLETVGLRAEHARRFPSKFSGGQRQRIAIARAIALEPKLIVADEPVSALDVSIQAQIVNLLLRLQRELRLTYVFISHDLGVVRRVSDRLAVMYLGRLVEEGPSEAVFRRPAHPYTRTLIDAVPRPDPSRRRTRAPPYGDPPSPLAPPAGCPFHTRCPRAQQNCREEMPQFVEVEEGRKVACFYPG